MGIWIASPPIALKFQNFLSPFLLFFFFTPECHLACCLYVTIFNEKTETEVRVDQRNREREMIREMHILYTRIGAVKGNHYWWDGDKIFSILFYYRIFHVKVNDIQQIHCSLNYYLQMIRKNAFQKKEYYSQSQIIWENHENENNFKWNSSN